MRLNPIPGFWFMQALLLVLTGLLNQARAQTVTFLPGDVPLVQVRIPAGTFLMGSPSTERSRQGNEDPTHTVTLSKDFYLGQTEVTQKQWLAIMGGWMGEAPSMINGLGDNYPVYFVSWNDITGAGGFIEKLNQYIASTDQGEATFRLPTEAEWEYACRAASTTRFYFGDSLSQPSDDIVDGPTDSLDYPGYRSTYMWFKFNSQGDGNGALGCKPVGLKPPNALGLMDISGNIWEWCQDRYGAYPSMAVTDPHGPSNGSTRVLRGGGWASPATHCRSAFRLNRAPDSRASSFGFRLARTYVKPNGASAIWRKMK